MRPSFHGHRWCCKERSTPAGKCALICTQCIGHMREGPRTAQQLSLLCRYALLRSSSRRVLGNRHDILNFGPNAMPYRKNLAGQLVSTCPNQPGAEMRARLPHKCEARKSAVGWPYSVLRNARTTGSAVSARPNSHEVRRLAGQFVCDSIGRRFRIVESTNRHRPECLATLRHDLVAWCP